MLIVQHYSTSLSAGPYGNPMTLEFSSLSPDDSDPITKETGKKIKIRVTKNHCVIDRNPYVNLVYYIEYGFGIEKYFSTLQQLINRGIIDARSAWLSLHFDDGSVDPEFKWQGKQRFKEDMIANPTKFDTLVSMLDGVTGDVENMSEEEITEIEKAEKELAKEMTSAGVEKVDDAA